jgi:hypothetical protein
MGEKIKIINNGGACGGAYFLTVIGAAVYLCQHSQGFWGFVGALLEALVWPAFAIYRAFQLMGM